MNKGTNNRRSRGRGGNKRQGNVRNQNFDSNGPGVKVRGSAQQVLDKYLILARDASSAGDRIAAESYFQYAEHYFRLLNTEEQRNAERHQANRGGPSNRDRGETPGGSEGGPEDTHGVSDKDRPAAVNKQSALPLDAAQPGSSADQQRIADPATAVQPDTPATAVQADVNEKTAEAAPVNVPIESSAAEDGQKNVDAEPKRPARGRRRKAPDLSQSDQGSDTSAANDAAD